MNLVLLLFAATFLGVTYGHGPHAGNFMASCPCFSFQGQNILWPAGPQGLAGMSSPMGCFNHPFFSGGGGGGCRGIPGMPTRPKLCPFGEPIEASSPASNDVEAHHDVPAVPTANREAHQNIPATSTVHHDVPSITTAPTVVEHPSSSVVDSSHKENTASLSDVPATVNVATSSVDIHAPADIAPPAEIQAPTNVATHSVNIHDPTPVVTPTVDINASTNVATHSVDTHAPAVITDTSANAPIPTNVATHSVDTHAPAVITDTSANAPIPTNVATPSEDISASASVITSSVNIPIHNVITEPSTDIPSHNVITEPSTKNVITGPSTDISTHDVITATSTDIPAPSVVVPSATVKDSASEASEPAATILPAVENPAIVPAPSDASIPAPVVEKNLLTSEVLPTKITTPIEQEEASASAQPEEPSSSDKAKPTDASNTTCPNLPVLPPCTTCPGIHPPVVDCPSLIDAHNKSCPGFWNTFPDFHQLCDDSYLDPHYCPNFDASGIHANQYIDQSCGIPCMHPCGGQEFNHYSDYNCPRYPPCYDPGYETRFLPPVSSLNVTDASCLNFTDIERYLPCGAKIVKDPSELNCTKHEIIKEVKPFIDECITHIPIIRNKIIQKEETITRHIPIVTDHVCTAEENRLCHIPVINQHARSIIGHHTDHIPITQSRLVPIVQSYTNQIPVKRSYIRPIVETSETHVPVVDTHCNPFMHDYVNTISVPEKRIRPVIHNVPVPYQNFDDNSLPSIRNYGAPPSCNRVQPDFDNSCGQPYEGEVSGIRNAPQYEQTLPNFRRNLYLQPPSIDYAQPEAPCSNGFPEYSEEPSAAPVEGHYQQGEFDTPSQDYFDEGCSAPARNYLPAPENTDQEPISAPLNEGIPFPQENAEDVSDDSAGYTRHPDYCE